MADLPVTRVLLVSFLVLHYFFICTHVRELRMEAVMDIDQANLDCMFNHTAERIKWLVFWIVAVES